MLKAFGVLFASLAVLVDFGSACTPVIQCSDSIPSPLVYRFGNCTELPCKINRNSYVDVTAVFVNPLYGYTTKIQSTVYLEMNGNVSIYPQQDADCVTSHLVPVPNAGLSYGQIGVYKAKRYVLPNVSSGVIPITVVFRDNFNRILQCYKISVLVVD